VDKKQFTRKQKEFPERKREASAQYRGKTCKEPTEIERESAEKRGARGLTTQQRKENLQASGARTRRYQKMLGKKGSHVQKKNFQRETEEKLGGAQ